MAKLFLSYAREDAAIAVRLAEALARAGHDVWWDGDLHGGASFGAEIERQLQDCDVVIVLWSAAAIRSPWVRDEAAVGRDAEKLVPIGIDGSEPPIGFRQFHAMPIESWRGSRSIVAKVQEAVGRIAGKAPAEAVQPRPEQKAKSRWVLIAGVGAIAAARPCHLLFPRGSEPLTIAVVPADSGAAQLSRDYAQSIAASMAPALANAAEHASVIDPASDSANARYHLATAVTSNGKGAEANLSLSSRSDRKIIWSQSWSEADLSKVDLKQQMSMVAARAMLSSRKPLISCDVTSSGRSSPHAAASEIATFPTTK